MLEGQYFLGFADTPLDDGLPVTILNYGNGQAFDKHFEVDEGKVKRVNLSELYPGIIGDYRWSTLITTLLQEKSCIAWRDSQAHQLPEVKKHMVVQMWPYLLQGQCHIYFTQHMSRLTL